VSRPAGLGALSALLLAGMPAAAQGRTLVVRSGDLEARVQTDPWRMTFAEERGGVLLEESAGRGASPAGALGARVGARWIHATRALEARRAGNRGAVDVVLATTDPRRRLRVRIAPNVPGVMSVRAAVEGSRDGLTALGAGFQSPRGERFLGLGERATGTDHRGETVESYVSDGPYLSGERTLLSSIIPAAGWRPRDDATYYPVPWLLSTRGYGVLVDNPETTYHRLGTTTRGTRRRRIGLQASLGTLHRPFAPCALRVDGRRLPARAWRYDAQTRVLRARFAVGRGVLEALRRGQAGCDG
jgi:Galactose mutarotase-like